MQPQVHIITGGIGTGERTVTTPQAALHPTPHPALPVSLPSQAGIHLLGGLPQGGSVVQAPGTFLLTPYSSRGALMVPIEMAQGFPLQGVIMQPPQPQLGGIQSHLPGATLQQFAGHHMLYQPPGVASVAPTASVISAGTTTAPSGVESPPGSRPSTSSQLSDVFMMPSPSEPILVAASTDAGTKGFDLPPSRTPQRSNSSSTDTFLDELLNSQGSQPLDFSQPDTSTSGKACNKCDCNCDCDCKHEVRSQISNSIHNLLSGIVHDPS